MSPAATRNSRTQRTTKPTTTKAKPAAPKSRPVKKPSVSAAKPPLRKETKPAKKPAPPKKVAPPKTQRLASTARNSNVVTAPTQPKPAQKREAMPADHKTKKKNPENPVVESALPEIVAPVPVKKTRTKNKAGEVVLESPAPVVTVPPAPETTVPAKEKKSRKPKAFLPPADDDLVIDPTEKFFAPDEDELPREAEEDEDFFPIGKPRGKARGPKLHNPEDDFMATFDDNLPVDDEEAISDSIELDPLDMPLDLLDPELVEVPRPAHPKPKPKVVKGERKMQKCDGCDGMFGWLSVDKLCFNCLKKKVAAKKSQDENYSSGFGGGGGGGGGGDDDGDDD